MSRFKVTEKAKRPASNKNECFYCNQKIGEHHLADCVLVRKMVKIKATVVYDVTVPSFWTASDIGFHRHDSSWCSDNFIREIESYRDRKDGCLCDSIEFECLPLEGTAFLDEE